MVRLAGDNRAWGYTRIQGELRKTLRQHRLPPAPTRSTDQTWRDAHHQSTTPTTVRSTKRPAAGSTWPGCPRHWEDILRVIASIHIGAVRAHDVIRMLSRDGHPTQLGEAVAHYGRIHKRLHVLRTTDDPGYRKTMKGQGNLQEGRHSLGREIFHGKRGELRQRYYEGMEDQLGALGLVLNAIVLFNTRYLDAAIAELRAGGHEVRDEDAVPLSPFVRHHMLGRYSFLLPADLVGRLRPLRDPNTVDTDERTTSRADRAGQGSRVARSAATRNSWTPLAEGGHRTGPVSGGHRGLRREQTRYAGGGHDRGGQHRVRPVNPAGPA